MAGLQVRLAVNDAAIRNLGDEIEARSRRVFASAPRPAARVGWH
jgi:hypothetical protein